MKKVYLAARYSRRLELCSYRGQLETAGCHVTSRWLNGDHQTTMDGEVLGPEREAQVEAGDYRMVRRVLRDAREDWDDLMAADTVISFTETPRTTNSRGSRHVEFGGALAAGKTCIVIGPMENVFHSLPQVRRYPTWSEYRAAWSDADEV